MQWIPQAPQRCHTGAWSLATVIHPLEVGVLSQREGTPTLLKNRFPSVSGPGSVRNPEIRSWIFQSRGLRQLEELSLQPSLQFLPVPYLCGRIHQCPSEQKLGKQANQNTEESSCFLESWVCYAKGRESHQGEQGAHMKEAALDCVRYQHTVLPHCNAIFSPPCLG